MRVLAARFPDRETASAALGTLQERLRLAEGDAAIAPLGTPGEGRAGDDTLLAGHFDEGVTGLVRSVVYRGGGEVVADVDETWTHPQVEQKRVPGSMHMTFRGATRYASRRDGRAPRQPVAS